MHDESTIASYKQNGFAVISGLFSAEELKDIERHLDAHLRLDVATAPDWRCHYRRGRCEVSAVSVSDSRAVRVFRHAHA